MVGGGRPSTFSYFLLVEEEKTRGSSAFADDDGVGVNFDNPFEMT